VRCVQVNQVNQVNWVKHCTAPHLLAAQPPLLRRACQGIPPSPRAQRVLAHLGIHHITWLADYVAEATCLLWTLLSSSSSSSSSLPPVMRPSGGAAVRHHPSR
jgi:hypothetical protein